MTSDFHALRSSDLDLAHRCVRGDTDAQRTFFHAHRDRVHCVLYRILGSNRDIDDVVQDAFLEIFRSLRTFRGKAQLGTWIDRICVRVARRHFGKRRPSVALELVAVADDPATRPDRRVEAREAARRLYAILDRVELSHRIAFVLHVVDGRPLAEVAEATEATLIATKLRVWRTRRRVEEAARNDAVLRGFLGDDEQGDRP